MQYLLSIIHLLLLALSLIPVLGTPTPALSIGLPTNTTEIITDLEKFDPSCDILCQTEAIVFQYSLAQFLFARNISQPPNLDWTSDGCTSAPDFPQGYNFRDSCYRHDFGYRNYEDQKRLFLNDNRNKIDKNFENDAFVECWKDFLGGGAVSEPARWSECRRLARIYYLAIRLFGKGKGKGKPKAHSDKLKLGKGKGTKKVV